MNEIKDIEFWSIKRICKSKNLKNQIQIIIKRYKSSKKIKRMQIDLLILALVVLIAYGNCWTKKVNDNGFMGIEHHTRRMYGEHKMIGWPVREKKYESNIESDDSDERLDFEKLKSLIEKKNPKNFGNAKFEIFVLQKKYFLGPNFLISNLTLNDQRRFIKSEQVQEDKKSKTILQEQKVDNRVNTRWIDLFRASNSTLIHPRQRVPLGKYPIMHHP